jgi:tetratricopeptide (TPR) repeat protein|tara:strand:- start:1842 stop:2177 length:336 start_codon:yes stop_codon:yes gene_type:complete
LTNSQLALDAYEKAARYDTQSVDAWNMLGLLQIGSGGLDAAFDAFQKVFSLGNIASDKMTAAAAHGNLGLIHQTRGDLEAACKNWRKALTLFEEVGAQPQIEQAQSLIDRF